MKFYKKREGYRTGQINFIKKVLEGGKMNKYKDYINQKAVAEVDKNSLVEKLKEIENSFKVTASNNGRGELSKKEYDTRTLDDIKEQAVALLSEYENKSKNSIDSEYENKASELKKELESSKEDEKAKKEEIATYIENVKQNASDDALKRGLARSSIIINKLNAFDEKQIEEFKRIDEEIAANVEKIESELALLNEKKEAALNNFDITYAVKLNEKISELEKEKQKYNDEVLEYNNKIIEQEREYADKLKENTEERNREVYEFLNEYGGNMLTNRVNSYKADYVISYLDSLPTGKAIQVLSDGDELKSALGDSYQKVLDYFKGKLK